MNYQKICVSEAISLIVIIMINQVILGSAKEIVTDTASSAWLHTIFLSIIAILLAFIICKLFTKFATLDIIDISEYLGGKFLKTITSILLIGFFILSATIIIHYISTCLSIIYLSNTNVLFLMLLFFIASIFVARYEINIIAKISLIVLFLLFIPIIDLFVFTLSGININCLFPVLGYGIKETFLDNITNIYSFSGLIYLFLITPFLKDSSKFKKIGLVSVIISSLYLFLTVLALLNTFPFASITEDLISIYLLPRVISFGSFFERVDSIYIFLWILSAFSYLSIIFYFITNTFQKVSKIKSREGSLYLFSSIIFAFSLLIKDITYLRFCQRVLYAYYSIALFIILFLILLFSYIKKSKKNSSINRKDAI